MRHTLVRMVKGGHSHRCCAGVQDANPAEKLPAREWYADEKPLAELVSPPFSEYAKITLKVSQNLYAN